MTATTTTAPKPITSPRVQRVIDETDELHAAAEVLLIAEAEGDALQTHELAVFDRLGWDDRRMGRERGRIQTVLSLQRKAGTAADRKLAAGSADKAEATRDEKAPAIREQIEALQQQINDLDGKAQTARAESDAMQRAAGQIQSDSLLPQHVREKWLRTVKAIVTPKTEALNKAKLAVTRARAVLDVSMADPATASDVSRRWRDFRETEKTGPLPRPWAITKSTREWTKDLVDPAAWEAYRGEATAALPGLERAVVAAEAAEAKARTEADKILAHYLG